jgi:hypothetical protein
MPTGPDPSRIYGYITLIDPQTNQRYLPVWSYFADGVPSYGGKADFTIIFRADATFRRVKANDMGVDNNVLTPVSDTSGKIIALRYDLHLRQQRGLSGEPSIAFGSHKINISYDPDLYQYNSLEITQFRIKDPNGSIVFGTTRHSAVPLRPRPTPFNDLQNF